MALENSIYQAISTVVKAQNYQFDKTIQATVIDNSDDNDEGAILVKYQDAILTAYVEKDKVSSYPKKTQVYVLIPNNDINSKKTIIGAVDSLGPLLITNKENLYQEDDSIIIRNGQFKKWGGGIYGNEISDVLKCDEINLLQYMPSSTIERIKELFLLYPSIRFSMNVTTSLDKGLKKGNYGIKIILKYRDGFFRKYETTILFDVNDFSGDPFCLDKRTQVKIIDNPAKDAYAIDSIEFYPFITNFPTKNNEQENYIILKDLKVDAVTRIREQESDELTAYIVAQPGQYFFETKDGSAGNQMITLTGVVKENRVQKDNKNLKCFWYMQEEEYIDEVMGYGWKKISNEKDEENFVQECKIPYSYLEDVISKDFKLRAVYGGQELLATTTLYNQNFSFTGILEYDSQKQEYTFEDGNKKIDFLNLKWYYVDETGNSHYLGSLSEGAQTIYKDWLDSPEALKNGKTLKFSQHGPIRDGQVWCEVYHNYNLITTLKAEYLSHAAEGILIKNSEQVFVYNYEGKIFKEEKENSENTNISNYKISTKSLSVKGAGTNFFWLVPKTNTLIEVTEKDYKNSFNVIDFNISELNNLNNIIPNYRQDYHVLQQPSLPFSVKDTWNEQALNNNILLYTNNTIYSTNFSFVKEGAIGTNGTGTYCRIVANDDGQVPAPPVPILYWKIDKIKANNKLHMNYGIESGRSIVSETGAELFKVQLWKNNNKITESITQENSLIYDINWKVENSVVNEDQDTYENYFKCVSSLGQGLFGLPLSLDSNSEQLDLDSFKLWQPKKISVQITYNNQRYYNFILLPTVYYSKDCPSFNIYLSNKYGTTIPMFCYYDNNGEIKESQLYNGTNQDRVLYFKYAKENDVLTTISMKNIIDSTKVITKENIASFYTIDEDKDIVCKSFYPGDNIIDSIFLSPQSTIDKTKLDFIIQIPLVPTITLTTSDIAQWDSNALKIDEKNNEILLQKVIAGKKTNGFSGGILGAFGANENGLSIFDEGRRTIVLNQDGTIAIGKKETERFNINPQQQSISINNAKIRMPPSGGLSITINDSSSEIPISFGKTKTITLKIKEILINQNARIKASDNGAIVFDSQISATKGIKVGSKIKISNDGNIECQNLKVLEKGQIVADTIVTNILQAGGKTQDVHYTGSLGDECILKFENGLFKKAEQDQNKEAKKRQGESFDINYLGTSGDECTLKFKNGRYVGYSSLKNYGYNGEIHYMGSEGDPRTLHFRNGILERLS